jgi:putative ABC transport system permease protein
LSIRLALGAGLRDAIASVMKPSLALAAVGIAVGLVLTWFASSLIRGLIWGVPPHDASTYIVVAAIMAGIAALASLLPALRTLKLDPAQTLREE